MALNSSPRTWTTSEVVTPTMLNAEIRDALTGIQAAWTSYSPTLGGSGVAIGNGTLTGKYTRLGKNVLFLASLTLGSTTTFGSSLTVTIPVANNANVGLTQAHGLANDISTGNLYALAVQIQTTGAILRVQGTNGLLSSVASTSPFTWANGDIVSVNGIYEAT